MCVIVVGISGVGKFIFVSVLVVVVVCLYIEFDWFYWGLGWIVVLFV